MNKKDYLNIIEKIREFDYKFYENCKNGKFNNWGQFTNDALYIQMKQAIEYEEYENCELIKQEIKKRNL